MDLLTQPTPFARFVPQHLTSEMFTLVDVGCAGGVHWSWTALADKLQVFGFDPDASEIEALNVQKFPGRHHYTCGFVGIPPRHPFALQAEGKPALDNNPWDRLAIAWWQALQVDPSAPVIIPPASASGPRDATPEPTILLPEFFASHHGFPIDFIKIDVDGTDLDILHSLDGVLSERSVLGIGIEVNYFGTHDPTSNTFHNVDRFLRAQGFDLFDVSRRKYSGRHLPAPSRSRPYPADTTFGRLLQGDAIYARDLAANRNLPRSDQFSPDAILKLAAIFSLFDLPDCAAELLIRYAARFNPDMTRRGLDLLTAQAKQDLPAEGHEDYLRAFRENPTHFNLNTRQRGMRARIEKIEKVADGLFGEPFVWSGATCRKTWGAFEIETAPRMWDPAILLPVKTDALDNRLVRIRMSVQVKEGSLGVSVQTWGGTALLQECVVETGKTVRLELHTPAAVAGIMMRSASPSTARARIRIESADVVAS